MQRTPRQTAPQVLQLTVGPALGLADLLRGIQERLGDELIKAREDRARAVHGVAVYEHSGYGVVLLAVDLAHLLHVRSRRELHTLVLESLQAQRGGDCHARMRRRQDVEGQVGSHWRGMQPIETSPGAGSIGGTTPVQ